LAPSRPSPSRRVPRLESHSRGHHSPVEFVSRASDAGKGTLAEGDWEATITIAFAPRLYEQRGRTEQRAQVRDRVLTGRSAVLGWLISRGAEMAELINLGPRCAEIAHGGVD